MAVYYWHSFTLQLHEGDLHIVGKQFSVVWKLALGLIPECIIPWALRKHLEDTIKTSLNTHHLSTGSTRALEQLYLLFKKKPSPNSLVWVFSQYSKLKIPIPNTTVPNACMLPSVPCTQWQIHYHKVHSCLLFQVKTSPGEEGRLTCEVMTAVQPSTVHLPAGDAEVLQAQLWHLEAQSSLLPSQAQAYFVWYGNCSEIIDMELDAATAGAPLSSHNGTLMKKSLDLTLIEHFLQQDWQKRIYSLLPCFNLCILQILCNYVRASVSTASPSCRIVRILIKINKPGLLKEL